MSYLLFPPRHVLLAGATGLVGSQMLQALLAEPSVVQVHALTRRTLDLQHPKLHVQVVDFRALPALPPVSEVYLALATTMRVAGSQAAFRAVDLDANAAVARAGFAAGARHIAVVSAIGANAQASNFYLRTKGELEDMLEGLGLKALVVARPSLLLGNRDALRQPSRLGEKLSTPIMKLVAPLLPRRYRPIEARDVAWALVGTLPTAKGTAVLYPEDMVRTSPPALSEPPK